MNRKVAVINPLANVYATHRKFAGLFSKIRTAEWSNIFVSPAVLLIGTILKSMGCAVKIYNDLQNEIRPNEMDEEIILISSITSSAKRAYEIASFFQDRKVILGGIHVSSRPEEAVPYADHVVVGECENVLPGLISGKTEEAIVYGEPVRALDKLPFLDFSLLKRLPEIVPVQTSRGCNFKCNFCSVPLMYGTYRCRSPENILAELRNYRENYGEIKKIDFRIDADFTFIRNRAMDIFRRMKAEEIKPKAIAANSRLQVFKDKELLSWMSQQNVILCVGIESLNQDVLDDYHKDQRHSDILEAVHVLHDNNIKVLGYFLFGADHDDRDTLKRYADFIHESRLDFFHISILTPYPGTGLYDRLSAQKRIFATDWAVYDGLHVTFKPAKMTAYTMQKEFLDFYQKEFSMKALFNPRLLFDLEVFRNKFLISMLTKMFEKDMVEYLSFLASHS